MAGRAERDDAGDVYQQAAQSDADHRQGVDRVGVAKPGERFDDDAASHCKKRRGVGERCQYFCASPAVSLGAGGRTQRDPRRHEHHAERGDVGGHVSGVGEQRERARPQAAKQLDPHVDGLERQHDREAVGRDALCVVMPVPVPVIMPVPVPMPVISG